MNDSKKITLLDLKKQYALGLRIPEIQRDYVMGAGGKDSDGNDKLKKLLDVIRKKCESKEDFDFSCIITYCSNPEDSPLEIYDGQQRLTTLMIMILYKLRSENKDVTRFANWYSFIGRPKANEIFDFLTQKEAQIDDIEVTDFTSFSIRNLLAKIARSEYKDITSDYLLNQVKFDMVSIGSQSEIEQFFMDLNSGVKLKDYELYKAKLTHRVNQLKQYNDIDTKDEIFEMWPHKMDNDWLNFFAIFADYEHPAEEYEIEFVKYCIDMIYIENNIESKNMQVDTISADIIKQVYGIMQMITELDLSFFGHMDEELLKKGILYYSWGKSDSENKKEYNYKLRGAFWDLAFEEYDKILYYIIKFVLLDAEKRKEMKDDALLWCLITSLDWQIDIQYEYLRLIKIILNHNVAENLDAWYECQFKGQYLYYCKYTVYAIPQYYGEHLKIDNGIKGRHSNMFLLNKSVIRNVKISNMLSREKIVNNLMEQIMDISKGNKDIENIINSRIQLLQMPEYYYNEDYVKKENLVFGIISKITEPIKEEYYYLEEVTLSWPIRKGGRSSLKECKVRLKCKTDLLFAEFSKDNDSIVEKTVSKIGKEFIDKCFWTDSNTVKKLVDRVTPTSTTYNKKDSDSGWCDTYFLD